MKITANGIEIHYTLAGDGPVVTLSHSLACNLSMWDDQLPALATRYRVLNFDTRGHGQSGSPPASTAWSNSPRTRTGSSPASASGRPTSSGCPWAG